MILRQVLWVSTLLACVLADPTQEYTLAISDQSPTISYYPEEYGNGTDSWNVTYSGTPWSAYSSTKLNDGMGNSTHWTNASDAVISFSFVGTGFKAYGQSVGGSTLTVQIDATTITASASPTYSPVSAGAPVLASAQSLTYGYHQVSLTRKGTGGLEFMGVEFSLAAGQTGTSYTNITVPTVNGYTLNEAFIWSPNDWGTTASTDGVHSIAFTAQLNATVSFVPPSNTSIMIITGDTSPETAVYKVSLGSDVYQAGSTNKTQPQIQSFEAITPWAASNQVLYFATMEPGHAYTCTIETTGPASDDPAHSDFGFVSVTYISATSDGPSTTTTSVGSSATSSPSGSTDGPRSRTGAIVGSVLGGILGIILIVVASWWCCCRKPKRRAPEGTGSEVKAADTEKPFEVDGYREMTDGQGPEVVPFTAPANPYERLAAASENTEKRSMVGFAPPSKPQSGSANTISSPNPTSTPQIPQTQADFVPVGTGTGSSNALEELDPNDPAFQRKWEVLHNLESEGTSSQSNASQVPSPTRTTRTREVDAGRIDGGEDTLPPDYNPAWAPRQP